tara:strand:+ start:101618 stop:102874 length:1257 start_codon:yes stop_codon:yes gene_type:complete
VKIEVKVPAVGESITEATIAEWNKSDGDIVARDEILMVLETDKASVDVVAEQAGKLSIKVEEGETVEIGAVVAEIDTEAAGAEASSSSDSTEPPPAPGDANVGTGSQKEIHPDLKNHMSPAVSKLVNDKNLDTSGIKGTGKDGRLTKADVMNAPTASASSSAPTAAAPTAEKTQAPPLPVAGGAMQEETVRKPMTTLRKTIAKRLVEAQQNAAILTTFNEVDMSQLMKLRAQYKDDFKKKYDISLGFMGFFVKAVVEALRDVPAVNAQIDGTDLVYYNNCHVGIAVSTPKGLVVPVIRNCEALTLAEIEQSIRHYALKARDGKISIDDLTGGTFTISNGGVFGSLMSTPILNPPQSGILGMHNIVERPVAVNGQVEIRPMMYVALSYDHRVIDGKESVTFLKRVKECCEDPTRMIMKI